MNSNMKLKLASVIGSLCACGFSAQTISAASEAPVLEEVVVTASKRGNVSLQDTAMSISVASEDMIAKTGMVGMDDFLTTLPATNFLDRGAGRNGIIIRGVTASPQTDTTVGVYVGETPLTGLGSASPGSGGQPRP